MTKFVSKDIKTMTRTKTVHIKTEKECFFCIVMDSVNDNEDKTENAHQ